MSEWSAPGAAPKLPAVQPPPPAPMQPGAPNPETGSTPPAAGTPKSAAQENLPAPVLGEPAPPLAPSPRILQGFDLMRIPGGIRKRWFVPAALGAIGAVAGGLLGWALLPVKATVSVRLMSRNPQSFASSTTSYTPSRPQGATLLGALVSPQVAREVAVRFGGGPRATELLEMVAVEEVKKTDFVDITVTAPYDASRTADLARLWGEEALRFTSKLQSEESSETKAYLDQQLKSMGAELDTVNKEITALREKAGVVDVDREIDAVLRMVSELDLRFETVQTDLQAVDLQLESLREKIRKHGPGYEELRAEENKLAAMAEYYTEQNPIYQESKDRVDKMREKINSGASAPGDSISEFTGTPVSNALYLQIVEAEGKRENLVLQLEQLRKLREVAQHKLKDLPQAQMAAAPLLERAQSLRTAQDALLKRVQEVDVFREASPGYFRMFKVPSAKDVFIGSKAKRALVGAVSGGVFLFLLGLLAAAGLEFMDSTVRTPLEAEAALGSPGLAHIPPPSPKTRESVLARRQDLWASTVGALSGGRVRAFWSPVLAPGTDTFWEALLDAGRGMGIRMLAVHLSGEIPQPLASLPRITAMELDKCGNDDAVLLELPKTLDPHKTKEIVGAIRSASKNFPEIWIEASGLVHEPMAGVLREFPEPVILCALGTSDRGFWRTQRTLLGAHRPLRGVVSVG